MRRISPLVLLLFHDIVTVHLSDNKSITATKRAKRGKSAKSDTPPSVIADDAGEHDVPHKQTPAAHERKKKAGKKVPITTPNTDVVMASCTSNDTPVAPSSSTPISAMAQTMLTITSAQIKAVDKSEAKPKALKV